jgi:hypothetical protein
MVLALAVSGCPTRVAYTPPASTATDDTVNLKASFDDTWNAVIQTFFQKNIPVRTLEKASGILESDDLHGEVGRDCDCGSYLGVPIGGYAGAYGGDAYYRFRVLVEKRGDRETGLTLRSSCRAKVEGVEGELVCRVVPAKDTELRTAISEKASRAGQSDAPAKAQP